MALKAVAVVIAIVAAFLSLSWWMPRRWYRALFYGGGKPNPVTKRLNAISGWLFARGILPSFLVTLELRGRKSGRTYPIPLVAAIVDGKRYLVSMLGGNVDWVKNVRAANGDAVLYCGTREEVTLREVPVAQRAPILKVYLARAPGGRPHFDIDMDAPLSEFEGGATRYPVFQIMSRAGNARG